jgi:hypothetical protein
VYVSTYFSLESPRKAFVFLVRSIIYTKNWHVYAWPKQQAFTKLDNNFAEQLTNRNQEFIRRTNRKEGRPPSNLAANSNGEDDSLETLIVKVKRPAEALILSKKYFKYIL